MTNDPNEQLGSRLVDVERIGLEAKTVATMAVVRQRRRIRQLAGVTIGLWLLAALLIPSVLLPMWAQLKHHEQGYTWVGGERKPTDQLTPVEAMQALALVSTFIAAVSTAASLLGAVATVWLVMTVRRNTLEQVNLGLAAVLEELRRERGRAGGA